MINKERELKPSITAGWSRLTTALIISVGFATPMQAQALTPEQLQMIQYREDTGASQRIDLSGKLRMLSQRIPAAACNYTAGIESATSNTVMNAAIAEFDAIMHALEFGDETLGVIGVEERRKTIVGLGKLRELWEPMRDTANQIGTGGGTAETVATLAEQSADVLKMAQRIVSEISGQYSDPTALLQSDAITIDIAGRQRMLTQRMSKNVCLIASGMTVVAAIEELNDAAQMFDISLGALRSGMDDAGIVPPPTADISAGLAIVLADWGTIQPIVARAAAGEVLDDEQRSIMFNGANTMTGHMNTVVGMYSDASKMEL